MPTKKIIPIQPVKSWSFSRYALYSECPAKFKYKNIDKIPDPGSAAMERGSAIHKLSEEYVKGQLKKLPAELSTFSSEYKKIRSEKVKGVEEDWAFKKDWSQTTWNDWNGCWLRVKLDIYYINPEHNALIPIDVKTGKYSTYKLDQYELQLELYALAGLKRFPSVDVVSPRLWYVDHGVLHPEEGKEYKRSDEGYLTKLWEGRIKKMMSDVTFKPTPSASACKWCPYSREKNGPCKY